MSVKTAKIVIYVLAGVLLVIVVGSQFMGIGLRGGMRVTQLVKKPGLGGSL